VATSSHLKSDLPTPAPSIQAQAGSETTPKFEAASIKTAMPLGKQGMRFKAMYESLCKENSSQTESVLEMVTEVKDPYFETK
jgi:hypothetical protein